LSGLAEIWRQALVSIPVIAFLEEGVFVRAPYQKDNRAWMLDEREERYPWYPQWDSEGRFWRIPKAWFNDAVNLLLERYGKVYIIQVYSETEKCAPACRAAKRWECECSCMGKYHGADSGGWFDVSETFSFRHGARDLACRLVVARGE
jgi:hypothetical protein